MKMGKHDIDGRIHLFTGKIQLITVKGEELVVIICSNPCEGVYHDCTAAGFPRAYRNWLKLDWLGTLLGTQPNPAKETTRAHW